MKKSFSILVILLAMSSVVFARRAETPTATSGVGIMKKGSTFHVFYKSPNTSHVRVNIYNAGNKLVYSETIRKVDGFVRPYNFEGLPVGSYTIELLDNGQRLVEKVQYELETKDNLATLIKVRGSDNKYMLSIPNKAHDLFSVKIYKDNQLLHEEQLDILNDFARVYNLNNVKGKVSFEVTDVKGNSTLLDN